MSEDHREFGVNPEQDPILRRLAEVAGGRGDAAEIARRSGIPESTLSDYLKGRTKLPFSRAAAIADAVGFSLDWLATGQGARMRGEQPSTPTPPPEQVAAAADHAVKEMIPAKMTAQDKLDLLRATLLAQDWVKATMPGATPDHVVIFAANYFSAMRKLPGTPDERYQKFAASISRDIENQSKQ